MTYNLLSLHSSFYYCNLFCRTQNISMAVAQQFSSALCFSQQLKQLGMSHTEWQSNPITGLDRLWGFQEVEAPIIQNNQHMKVVRLSALFTSHFYPSGNIPGTHFCYRLRQTQGHNACVRIVSMKNSNDTIGNRTRDLLGCSAVPQLTAPLGAPHTGRRHHNGNIYFIWNNDCKKIIRNTLTIQNWS
jgi:hypothetical protein